MERCRTIPFSLIRPSLFCWRDFWYHSFSIEFQVFLDERSSEEFSFLLSFLSLLRLRFSARFSDAALFGEGLPEGGRDYPFLPRLPFLLTPSYGPVPPSKELITEDPPSRSIKEKAPFPNNDLRQPPEQLTALFLSLRKLFMGSIALTPPKALIKSRKKALKRARSLRNSPPPPPLSLDLVASSTLFQLGH